MVHTPLVLTGETRETQEKHTPAKAQTSRGQMKVCSLSLMPKFNLMIRPPRPWPVVVFSYHIACWNRVGGKINGSKSWFLPTEKQEI